MSDETKDPVDFHAILVAAGDGQRLGVGKRKAGVLLQGEPMVCYSLRTLCQSPELAGGVLVVHPDDVKTARRWLAQADVPTGSWIICAGGETRSDSVAAGLRRLPTTAGWALIHDAARPLLHPDDLQHVINEAREHGAATLASPVDDSIHRSDEGGFLQEPVPRDDAWYAETPQVFRVPDLRKAHDRTREGATDDATLVHEAGVRVRLVESRHPNPKITRPRDLRLAVRILEDVYGG